MFMMKYLIFLASFYLGMHDYHSSIMNFEYNSEKKVFEIDFEVPTDHFEEVLQHHFKLPNFKIDEDAAESNRLIEKYLSKTIYIDINNKKQSLEIYRKEVDYAITTLYFNDIAYKKRKLKKVSIQNTFLIDYFEGQKNLINIYYKGEKESLIFDQKKSAAEISW